MDLSETCSTGTPAFTNCHTDMGVSFLKDIVPSKCALPSVKKPKHCNHYIKTSSMKCESFKAAYSYAEPNIHVLNCREISTTTIQQKKLSGVTTL
jgi:hypothetical protein